MHKSLLTLALTGSFLFSVCSADISAQTKPAAQAAKIQTKEVKQETKDTKKNLKKVKKTKKTKKSEKKACTEECGANCSHEGQACDHSCEK